MALVRCILGKFLGVVCHCFPPSVILRKNKKKLILVYVFVWIFGLRGLLWVMLISRICEIKDGVQFNGIVRGRLTIRYRQKAIANCLLIVCDSRIYEKSVG
jgi:hypothetical protein